MTKEVLMIQSIYQVSDYQQEKVNAAVAKILEDQEIAKDLKPQMKVVIKPNLIMAKPTTTPATTA